MKWQASKTDTTEVVGMTDEQARRAELEARLDEINRIEDIDSMAEILEYLKVRKKELRQKIDSLT